MDPYLKLERRRPWHEFIAAMLVGLAIGIVPGALKVKKLNADVAATVAQTGKEITELHQQVLGEQQVNAECLKIVQGDGAKTILMDVNHPYGQFVPTAAVLPPGYIPGPVWIINRRVVPQTMDGTLNGKYAYLRPDGRIDGWFTSGGK